MLPHSKPALAAASGSILFSAAEALRWRSESGLFAIGSSIGTAALAAGPISPSVSMAESEPEPLHFRITGKAVLVSPVIRQSATAAPNSSAGGGVCSRRVRMGTALAAGGPIEVKICVAKAVTSHFHTSDLLLSVTLA